jgi:hypothetical protein
MNKMYIKKIFGKKPWAAVLLVMALSFGACLETEKTEDDTSQILGLFLLNQQNQPVSSGTTAAQPTTCTETTVGCRIFTTNNTFTGNLGGISGADEKCNADSNKPTGNLRYKALLVDADNRTITINSANTANPTVTGTKDWALKANTKYVQKDGTEFATTTAAGIFVNNNRAMHVGRAIQGLEIAVKFAFSGLTPQTGGQATIEVSTNTCTNWSADATVSGTVSQIPNGNETIFAGNAGYTCNQRMHLICVEQ